MNKKNFSLVIFAAFIGTFLRFYINNNFLISILGSFLFGFVIARKLSQSKKEILLTGFCSCFTSFSGFIYVLYDLIDKENFLRTFFYLNINIILNLFMMHFGFYMSRKIN